MKRRAEFRGLSVRPSVSTSHKNQDILTKYYTQVPWHPEEVGIADGRNRKTAKMPLNENP